MQLQNLTGDAHNRFWILFPANIISLFLLSISLGNLLTSGVNFTLARVGPEMLAGPNYYLFFAAIMAVATLSFIVAAGRYHGRTQLQPEA